MVRTAHGKSGFRAGLHTARPACRGAVGRRILQLSLGAAAMVYGGGYRWFQPPDTR
jgi:hypothetical protein